MQFDQKVHEDNFISHLTGDDCVFRDFASLVFMQGDVLLTSITPLAYFRSFPRTIELQ